MTNLAKWSTNALSALCFELLVSAGLAGCTPGMTAESPPAADQSPAAVAGDPWPRQFTVGDDTFSVFQPQYESWHKARLDARSAVAVENPASPQPAYGVIWFTARTQIDKETRTVALEDLTISKADFPTATDGGTSYLKALGETLSAEPPTIALDRLQAELEVERVEDPGRIVQVTNAPPRILVSQKPALLLRIDGQPVLRQVAGTGLLRVINTRVLLLLDQSAGGYYVWLADRWVTAPKLDGPWTALASPPDSLESAKQAAVQSGQVDLLDKESPDLERVLQEGAIPTIYVSTAPTELIVLQGEPALSPIAATNILEITNTDADLFFYTPEQHYYALLSGRWYHAKSLQGPWEFAASGQLPQDFAKIPESHPKGEVLASVAGTTQAREAVIANDIPQTATISRSEAKLSVQYDGAPRLAPIDGTSLQYVMNASTPVIRVGAPASYSYYALQNGVWFVGSSLTGSWAAATDVPEAIYSIPPTSPLHYVTYAYVYGSTADVVYTGYTPGYLGMVVAPGPLVVYGTGYPYAGWADSLWYPAPVTWGWSPYDLGFGVDVFTGFEFGFAVGPYWGWHRPWGWHGGCCWGWHHGISHVNVYNHWGDHTYLHRNTELGWLGRAGRLGRIGGTDAYADHDGQVYRREGDGHWSQHNRSGGWDGMRAPMPEHEQWHSERQLGEQRLGDFNHGLAAHGFGGESHGVAAGSGGFHGFGGGGFHGGGGFSGGGFHGGGGGHR